MPDQQFVDIVGLDEIENGRQEGQPHVGDSIIRIIVDQQSAFRPFLAQGLLHFA
jgi:hypothetical protein